MIVDKLITKIGNIWNNNNHKYYLTSMLSLKSLKEHLIFYKVSTFNFKMH